jgi:hypothetical protein
MSLTGTIPEKFSTSQRRDLMTKTPEKEIPKNTLERKESVNPAKMPGSKMNTGKIKPEP